jgi:hypothetical protein
MILSLHNMKKNMLFESVVFACIIALACCCGSQSSEQATSDPEVSGDNTTITTDGSGAKFDNKTELETGFQGLTVGDVYIVDGSDKRISGNEIALNSTFSIIYEGVRNYTLKDGKAFPDLSIVVTDASQNPVISEQDLLASYAEGLSEEDASVLRASVTAGSPMKQGKYMCSIQIVDKNNKDAAITSTWAFDVK